MYIAYQPIVRLSDREIVGYEALARFEGGQTPDDMFKAAWEVGEAEGVDLEAQAISMAIEQFPYDIKEAFLAINASARTIMAMKGELTKDPGMEVPWPHLVVEISEKEQVHPNEYQVFDKSLSVLRDRQVRLAIDDYGAGSGSLLYIAQINPAIIKIDRAPIKDLGDNSSKRSIVSAIVRFANLERSAVVAEGIETEDQLEWCAGLGVVWGQGYLFGRPQPFDDASS